MPTDDPLSRDRRAARRNFRASLMSNAKWSALLRAAGRIELDIRQVVVKFIEIDGETPIALPWIRTRAFADSVELGPFPLVGIEWLEFPHVASLPRGQNVPPREHSQDVSAIRLALEATGKQFPLQETPTGLRIVGHLPR